MRFFKNYFIIFRFFLHLINIFLL